MGDNDSSSSSASIGNISDSSDALSHPDLGNGFFSTEFFVAMLLAYSLLKCYEHFHNLMESQKVCLVTRESILHKMSAINRHWLLPFTLFLLSCMALIPTFTFFLYWHSTVVPYQVTTSFAAFVAVFWVLGIWAHFHSHVHCGNKECVCSHGTLHFAPGKFEDKTIADILEKYLLGGPWSIYAIQTGTCILALGCLAMLAFGFSALMINFKAEYGHEHYKGMWFVIVWYVIMTFVMLDFTLLQVDIWWNLPRQGPAKGGYAAATSIELGNVPQGNGQGQVQKQEGLTFHFNY